jgi:hypothetical protein
MEIYNSEMINQQTYLIKQLFNMLDMPDVIYEFEKKTPFNVSYQNLKYVEYAPYDIILEEQCIFGPRCLYKKNPLMCSLNHQNIGTIIKKGHIIPNTLCKYERPWKTLNGKKMRCTNQNCWFSHIKNHMLFINNYK